MSSTTDIVNLALVPLLGCSRIQNINDDQTEAIVMKEAYASCRDSVLEERAWSFATARDAWTPTADEPSWGYTYSYLIPSTILRVLEVEGSNSSSRSWVVEGDRLLTNRESINVKYLQKVDNTNLFNAGFINALSIYLAWFCCIALSENRALKDSLWMQYQQALSEAASSDGQQGSKQKLTSNALLAVR